ncbi:J domain-containing protein [Streptomyces sp. NPDC002994]|uniref:J domain-containing protein n=1 Tax=Streptomyces sp. NPDC002994 TaxID=3154441 RepID=UPI0033A79EAE
MDLYAVLDISPDAPPAIIRRAYRQQLLRLHPDRRPQPGLRDAERRGQAADV